MQVKEAAKILVNQLPGRIITGYWTKPEGIVFNTRTLYSSAALSEPAQFMVTNNGEVYGTNPITSDLDLKTMRKYRYS